jgi:hypothetical protein
VCRDFLHTSGYRFQAQLAVVEADEAQPLIAALESNFMRLWAHRVGTHNKSTDKEREKNEGRDEVKYDLQ